jgi:hypothetical protein
MLLPPHQALSFPRTRFQLYSHPVLSLGIPPVLSLQEYSQCECQDSHEDHEQSAGGHAGYIPWSITAGIQPRSNERPKLANDVEHGDTSSLTLMSDAVIHTPGNNNGDGGEKPESGRVDEDVSNSSVDTGWHMGVEVARQPDHQVGERGQQGVCNQIRTPGPMAIR